MKEFLLSILSGIEKMLIGAIAQIEEHSVPAQAAQGVLKASCEMYVKAHPGTILAAGCREILVGIKILEAQENADAAVGSAKDPTDPMAGAGG